MAMIKATHLKSDKKEVTKDNLNMGKPDAPEPSKEKTKPKMD